MAGKGSHAMTDKIEVQNVGQPGKTYRVDAAKYAEMRTAVLGVTPAVPPGLTPAEIIEAVKPHLSEALFPGGETAGWWVKCVQLDLEAKGVLKRGPKGPVRLWRV
jgi:hypothetical protein